MNSITIQKNILDFYVVNEDYFPLKVVNDPSVESTKYVEFCFGDTDLLEFSLDREANTIKKILLVLCNHFEVLNEDLHPLAIPEDGCISISLPQHNECDTFSVRVYSNAIDILLSNLPVQRTVKSGQVHFGLSVNNDLVNITVAEMTNHEIMHAIKELNWGIANG